MEFLHAPNFDRLIDNLAERRARRIARNDPIRQKMKEKFVKDAILDAAIDQLAAGLMATHLLGLFIACYLGDQVKLRYKKGIVAGFCYNAMPCPNPAEARPTPALLGLLETFVHNLNHTESKTGISGEMLGVHQPSIHEFAQIYAEEVVDTLESSYTGSESPDKRDLFIEGAQQIGGLSQIEQWALRDYELPTSAEHASAYTAWTGLRAKLEGVDSKMSFTCSGSIPIKSNTADHSPGALRDGDIGPVQLWFSKADGSRGLVTFGDSSDRAPTDIGDLLKSCSPATFGRGGEDILDRGYRDAVKLDSRSFSTSFHPHDCGILDQLEQVLLHSLTESSSPDAEISQAPLRIRASLYSLNVYSAPSGKFKAHVDTPRSPWQFGSLVVSLPSLHTGGELRVEHGSTIVDYEWGSSRNIEWAAFYSDCQHSVSEVTEGHRITLTYNLYRDPTSSVVPRPFFNGFKSLEDSLQAALDSPHFMPAGGILGFYCRHAYAHSRDSAQVDLPAQLKGIDMAFLSALRGKGIITAVRPILTKYKSHEDMHTEMEENLLTCPSDDSLEEEYTSKTGVWEEPRGAESLGDPDSQLEYLTNTNQPQLKDTIQLTFEERLEYLLTNRSIKGLEKKSKQRLDRVGRMFHTVELHDKMCEGWEETRDMVDPNWNLLCGIEWLNQQKHEELAIAHITYGNEAELSYFYAAAAILAHIPPWTDGKRQSTGVTKPTNQSDLMDLTPDIGNTNKVTETIIVSSDEEM